ncbi:MAG: SufE family protein [Chlamydiales bacterium]
MNEGKLYQQIIDKGKELTPFHPAWKTEENLVSGCQSIMYLHSELTEGKITYFADSKALISRGLAALLLAFYNGKEPEFVLKNPPIFLEKEGIVENLTPGRANGVASLYLKMKQQALAHLLAPRS